MSRFLLFFLLNVIIFYLILEFTNIEKIVTSLVVQILEYPFSWITINYILEGNIFKLDNGTMLIDNECNGLKPIALFLSALLAYPSTFRIKILWIIYSVLFLQFLNIVRVVTLTWILRYHLNLYDLIHDYISPFIMISIALYFFYIYTISANRSLENLLKH